MTYSRLAFSSRAQTIAQADETDECFASGAAGDGKHNASSKTYGAVRRCWRCGYVDVMGNVRVDSEFESGAARGGGGDAGLLPAIM